MPPFLRYAHHVKDRYFAPLFTAIFGTLTGIGLWRHEMWRDEYHAWGLALYSDSFSQLLSNLRGEGHLPFSYTVFYFLSRLTANPHAVQVAQFFTAAASAYLLLRYAPFKRWQKVLLLSGYFPLYEYGVMSRSYTWDMLGLFGFCAVYGRAKEHGRKPWPAWIFLLIMTTNEPFGALMAVPLAGLLIHDMCASRKTKKVTWIRMAGIVTISVMILGYALLRVIPLGQWTALTHRLPRNPTEMIGAAISVTGRAVLPKIHLPRSIWDFPALKDNFLALQGFWQYAAWLVAAIILLALLYCFLRLFLASMRLPFTFYHHPPIFRLWAGGAGLLFLFLWSIGGNVDDARHSGHFYLFFVACWWLSCHFPKHKNTPSPRWMAHVDRHAESDLRFLLLTQLVFGFFAYGLDLIYPFSANQATAKYIQSHHLQHAALIAPESVAIPLARAAYFPRYDLTAKVLRMRDSSQPGYLRNPTGEQIARRTWHFIQSQNPNTDVVLVVKKPVTNPALQKYFQWQSPLAIINAEQYYLYYIPQGALEPEQNR